MTTNYFDFFGLSPSFFIDEAALQSLFYKNSKAYHPDFHALKTEQEQTEILELSTQNNRAYLCLKDFYTRLPYVLELLGVMQSDEKYALDPDFLMEMMELNEELTEIDPTSEEALKAIHLRVAEMLEELDLQIKSNCKAFDPLTEPNSQMQVLSQIKDLWYRRKYLLRIGSGA